MDIRWGLPSTEPFRRAPPILDLEPQKLLSFRIRGPSLLTLYPSLVHFYRLVPRDNRNPLQDPSPT